MLNHTGTITLKTDRLILRRVEFNDIYDISRWKSDKDVSKNMAWSKVGSLMEVGEHLNYWLEQYETSKDFYLWGIALKENGKLMGRIKITAINNLALSGELDYCLAKEYWGKGYVTEAAKKIIEYAFEEVGFNRIFAEHIVGNEASGKIMKKCNMQYEGLLRQVLKNELGFFDCKLYAILKEDYDANKREDGVK